MLSSDEIIALVKDAADSGALTETQADEILLADVIVHGKHREDNSEVYLVVEVSWCVDVHDVERAANRAKLLSQIGTPAIPAQQEKAWQLANGRTVIPESATTT